MKWAQPPSQSRADHAPLPDEPEARNGALCAAVATRVSFQAPPGVDDVPAETALSGAALEACTVAAMVSASGRDDHELCVFIDPPEPVRQILQA